MKRLVVGMSGASGAIYGVRLLQVLRTVHGLEIHLVMSLGRPSRWKRPRRAGFRLVRGPVPQIAEEFALTENDGTTALE